LTISKQNIVLAFARSQQEVSAIILFDTFPTELGLKEWQKGRAERIVGSWQKMGRPLDLEKRGQIFYDNNRYLIYLSCVV
jgi:hypothetical protein